ncbi:unnamed protein product [Miscanthus lutarioriparius]|uniref:Uncharacterized protein n=1 Tax=Miscanthus lutarioriparius TaxID=422564 RepID=A0A811P356_9POAL|nr:unnamed protein product [Miscanthus lutarioriparius]
MDSDVHNSKDNKLHHHSKKNLNILKEGPADSYKFKEKLVLYFGSYLPAKVINELCVLVRDNSYGKCSYFAMPTESLVLGLLQILVGAGSKIGETIDKNVHVSATKLTNPTKDDRDEADRTKPTIWPKRVRPQPPVGDAGKTATTVRCVNNQINAPYSYLTYQARRSFFSERNENSVDPTELDNS